MKELQLFFDKEFKDCVIDTDIVCSTKLNYILAYEAIDMVKNIENTILTNTPIKSFPIRTHTFSEVRISFRRRFFTFKKRLFVICLPIE